MANEEHLTLLQQGMAVWNLWRGAYPDIRPDLAGADLREANLIDATLAGADLSEARLMGATLIGANLSKANLNWADLSKANLAMATLAGADLTARLNQADLTGATLTKAILCRANLYQADLTGALLLDTNLKGANLTGCFVYGIAAWNINLAGAQQADLVITPTDEPVIVVVCKQWHPNPQTSTVFGSHSAPTSGHLGSHSPPMSPHFLPTACKQPAEPTFAANNDLQRQPRGKKLLLQFLRAAGR